MVIVKHPSIADVVEPVQQFEEDSPKMHFAKGALGCLGGLFIHLIIASLYQWGIINIYVTSYFKTYFQPSITLEQNTVVFPAMMISIGLTMRLGLFLGKKIGVLITLYLMNFLCAAMVFASSFMTNFIGTFYLIQASLCYMELSLVFLQESLL